jgi:hypothetical protein
MFGKPWFGKSCGGRPRRKGCPLQIEALENRCTPSVTAGLVNGSLVVVGDSGYNQVGIGQTADNEFVVFGTGLPLTNFSGVTGDLTVSMAGANDLVGIGVRNAPGNIAVMFGGTGDGSLDIHTNVPDFAPASVQGGLNVQSTRATAIWVSEVSFSGNATINLGTGQQNLITFRQGSTVSGTTQITTHGGDDYVDVQAGSSLVGDTTVDLHETGHLFLEGTVAGNLTVTGYDRSTDVELRALSLVRGNVAVGLGAGNDSYHHDYFVLDGTVNSALNVVGGNPPNTLLLQPDSVVNGSATFRLGAGGSSTLNLQGTLHGGLNYTGSMNGDAITVRPGSDTQGSVQIEFGGGDNSLGIEAANAPGSWSIHGGSGNNSLSLYGTFGPIDVQLTGAGNNTVLLAGATVANGLRVSGGNGVDYVDVGYASEIRGNVVLNLGDGDNVFNFSGLINSGSLTCNGGNGQNTVYLAGEVRGNVDLDMGFGQSQFNFSGRISGGHLNYQGGGDQDLVVFSGQVTGDVSVYLMGGNDIFYLMTGESVSGVFQVDGGGGNSTFDGTAVGGRGDVTILQNFAHILP